MLIYTLLPINLSGVILRVFTVIIGVPGGGGGALPRAFLTAFHLDSGGVFTEPCPRLSF